MLYDMTGDAFNVRVLLEKYPYLKNKIIRDNNKGLTEFFEKFKKDERLFKILFANYYNSCIDTDMFNYAKLTYGKKYTDKEVKELILGFYSLYGDAVYKIVNRYFDEGRIQTGSAICENRTDGTFYNSILLKSGYIVIKEEENNIKLLTSLAHELGHAVDYGMVYHPQQKKGKFYSDIYQEVSSSFFEYGFVKYLLENKIECDESLCYMVLFIYQMYYRISSLIDAYSLGKLYSTEPCEMLDNNSNIIYSLGVLWELV
jgi:oligoendopeptidase F